MILLIYPANVNIFFLSLLIFIFLLANNLTSSLGGDSILFLCLFIGIGWFLKWFHQGLGFSEHSIILFDQRFLFQWWTYYFRWEEGTGGDLEIFWCKLIFKMFPKFWAFCFSSFIQSPLSALKRSFLTISLVTCFNSFHKL